MVYRKFEANRTLSSRVRCLAVFGQLADSVVHLGGSLRGVDRDQSNRVAMNID